MWGWCSILEYSRKAAAINEAVSPFILPQFSALQGSTIILAVFESLRSTILVSHIGASSENIKHGIWLSDVDDYTIFGSAVSL
mmetsp:Transcript_3121/g.5129  ORF Transcript_3121/g.5129 Transcript_3121/m.5129 type:complete len:83 (+) Transcript_3121:860-1108(+)